MSLCRIRLLLTIVLTGTSLLALAQPKDNSPYSRLGLGDFVNQQFAANSSFGGLSAALQDPFHINLLNPASLAYLRSTSYELGFYAKYADLKGADESAGIWSGNLNYMALGFPMRNPLNDLLERRKSDFNWGMTLALLPYTNVGYDLQITEVQPNVDTTINIFQGTGGTYELYWGNGMKYKDLTLGLNLGYFFGKISNSREVSFSDLGVAYQNSFDDEISVRGLLWSLGAQYRLVFKKPGENGVPEPSGHRLIFGAYGNSSQPFDTNSSKFYRGINFLYSDVDTVLYEKDVLESGKLPAEVTAGITYEYQDRLRLGIEYAFSQWSNYENEAKPENLSDRWRIAFGGEYIPDATSYNDYGKRIRYRFGMFYAKDPRSFDNTLQHYGLTFGFGLPIILPRQQTSFVNFAFELGQFGNADTLRETYGKLTVGFTLNDNSWFFKRKFN